MTSKLKVLKQYEYYIIIGIISLVALFFFPMIGSEAGLAWTLPDTTAGWIVYVTSKLLVAIINILIFHCFILQAKINIQDDEKYLEAVNILERTSPDDTESLRSPDEYFKSIYGKKGIAIFVTSILSAVGLTQAVLTFDWISMLTYFFTILMGTIFGILQMNQVEIYWTTEYLRYAKKTQKDKEEADLKAMVDASSTSVVEEKYIQQTNDITGTFGGTDLLESSNSSRDHVNN